jgi:hypothetical protein
MNAENPPVAMVGYNGFWDGFFSLPTFSALFMTAGIAAFIVAIYRVARSSPLHTGVRSILLLICSLPFLFCSAAALCDLWRLHWDWRSYYPSPWASNAFHLALFGAVLSTIAIGFYARRKADCEKSLK